MELLTPEEKANLNDCVNNLFIKRLNLLPIIDQSNKYTEIQFENDYKIDFFIWKSNGSYHMQYRKYVDSEIDINQSYHVYQIERLYEIIDFVLKHI